MSFSKSRRSFIFNISSLAAASVLPTRSLAEPSLYPPINLSYFDKPITPAPSAIRFGYAAITWGGNDMRAINDISDVGFRGIQLRASAFKKFGENPKELRDILKEYDLQFTALSGGGPQGSSYNEADEIATQVRQAAFLRDAGGLYLQMTDSSRPKDRKPKSEDFNKLAHLLTEVGKRAKDLGIMLGYHNHMDSLGQSPDEVDAIMDRSDSRYVKLLLDVAHYAQGGGDPAKAIRKYRDRILFLHIKDVESLGPEPQSQAYRFVELGRGRVDLPAVFAALKEIRFRGWAIVELDNVPDKSRTPKESAIISKKYLEEKLAMKI
jgi:inosose dehydratase